MSTAIWSRIVVTRSVLVARRAWWDLIWTVARNVFCRRVSVKGSVPRRPVVFAAPHASHADTAVMQRVLSDRGIYRLLAAGAEDYWFRNWAVAVFASLVGVFPFPRTGSDGLRRTRLLLDGGWSVLLFPQGTRGGGPFRSGVGVLAAEGATVVPVSIAGTDQLLPKGAFMPRRADIDIRFGEPMTVAAGETPARFTARLEHNIVELAA